MLILGLQEKDPFYADGAALAFIPSRPTSGHCLINDLAARPVIRPKSLLRSPQSPVVPRSIIMTVSCLSLGFYLSPSSHHHRPRFSPSRLWLLFPLFPSVHQARPREPDPTLALFACHPPNCRNPLFFARSRFDYITIVPPALV